MNLLQVRLLQCAIVIAALFGPPVEKTAAASGPNQSLDPGWPREHYSNGTRLIIYQPQIDAWKNFQDLAWRMAVAITPKGGKEVIGIVEMKGKTTVDNVNKIVHVTDAEITGTHFPPASAEKVDQLLKTFNQSSFSISLLRLVACAPKLRAATPGVQLNNEPPKIFVGFRPSVLLNVDGPPVLSEIPNTNLKFMVNTQWPLFFDGTNYFVPVGQAWLTASSLDGSWSATRTLPRDMSKLPQDKQWAALKKVIPAPAKAGIVPAVFYSDKPAEVILFDGQPVYSQIPGTQLTYATNTNSVVFVYTPTQQFYYLTAGRWFRASDLQGPWTFATPELPADFAKIPVSSPTSAILASVPGTPEAEDAILLAQVPTTVTVKPAQAQSMVKVQYSGDPHFEQISGTSMSYATNTNDKVIKVGDVYYLCLQGVWFLSPNPQGPWTTANSVPQEIYTIPPTSPVYNVTYVTQTTNPDGTVQASYTAGYLGAFVLGAATGAIIANGSGYWWPPYCSASYTYKNVYNYPAYYPYATPYGGGYYATPHYNSATGAYGWSQTAYGPYGSATRAAGYNPYTGTAARGATISTPYGSRSAAQAYNPYTGTYAATRQGSSPTAQWGSSYVSQGNKSAYTQHYSNANGTVATAQGSQGGKAAASSTAWGNSAAAKTANGNMYAGHDGNVYKNTGNGWESYNNGSWSSAKASPNFSQATQPAARTEESQTGSSERSAAQSSYDRGGGDEMQNMQREDQDRQRGDQRSQDFDRFGGGGGDRFGGGGFGGRGGGGGGGWGGRGGGGGRRR